MKILVVYESNEKSTANHYASLFIDELNRYSNNVISEIHLNSIFFKDLLSIKDILVDKYHSSNPYDWSLNMPTCLEYFHFIASQIENSTLVLFVPSENDTKHERMKFLLDILSNQWMPHKCNKNFHNKIAIILYYLHDASFHKYIKDMKYDLLLWGLKNVMEVELLKYKHMDYDLNLLKITLMANKAYSYSKDLYINKCFFIENLKNNIYFKKNKFKFLLMKAGIMRNLLLSNKL